MLNPCILIDKKIKCKHKKIFTYTMTLPPIQYYRKKYMLPSAEKKNMLDLLNSTVDFGCTQMFCCGYGCCALPTGSSMTVRAGVLDVWVAGKHLPRMSTHGSCADDVHHQPSDTLTQPRRNIQKYVCLCCAQWWHEVIRHQLWGRRNGGAFTWEPTGSGDLLHQRFPTRAVMTVWAQPFSKW